MFATFTNTDQRFTLRHYTPDHKLFLYHTHYVCLVISCDELKHFTVSAGYNKQNLFKSVKIGEVIVQSKLLRF